MKLKDLELDFPKEKKLSKMADSDEQTLAEVSYDRGFNSCRKAFLETEIEVDVEKLHKFLCSKDGCNIEWIGEDTWADNVNVKDLAQAISDNLPNLLRGKQCQKN